MPPFGNLYLQRVFVDQSLVGETEMAFNAGTHTDAIRMHYADFAELANPVVGVIRSPDRDGSASGAGSANAWTRGGTREIHQRDHRRARDRHRRLLDVRAGSRTPDGRPAHWRPPGRRRRSAGRDLHRARHPGPDRRRRPRSVATPVSHVMSTQLFVAEVGEPCEVCLHRMQQAQVRHLIVLDHGRLAGIVSLRDLMTVDLDEKAEAISLLNAYVIGCARATSRPDTQASAIPGVPMRSRPRYPGIRVTANGNQLVSYHTETRIADAGVFYPITPSTEGGELYQQAFAEGKLNVFGQQHHRRRSGRRTRRPGRRDRALGVRKARRQLHLRPGRRLRRRAVLPRSRQVLHDGPGGGGARADQARPERPLRARRRVRRARHGMDHRLRQGRPAGRRPVAHSPSGDRAQSDARDERHGRLPHLPPRADVLQARIGADPPVPRARRKTSSTVRPRASACSSVRSAAACRR